MELQENLINGFVKSHLLSVQRHIQAYGQTKKPSHLHQLRVEIKEIRALFSFSSVMYNHKLKANDLDQLFHQAGKIREIRIVIQLLKTMPGLSNGIVGQLKRKEKKRSHQFIKNSAGYIKQAKGLRKQIAWPERLPDSKKIEKYFKTESQQAIKKLSGKNRNSLHRYRMKMKKLMAVYNFLPRKAQKEVTFNRMVAENQSKQLGNWHDTYAAIVFLSKQHHNRKVKECIAKLRIKERKQWNDLLNTYGHF